MKRKICILFVCLIGFPAMTSLWAQTEKAPAAVVKQENMDFLFDYYTKTLAQLEKSVKGLTEAQLNFKPDADSWSVAQCLDHIVMTEKMLFDYAKKGLDSPANPDRRSEVKLSDQEIIKVITDRSEKFKAPEMLQGTGKYKDAETALNDLKQHRKKILAFLKNTSLEDLRNHISDTPGGPADAYQSFLYVAGHTARHTLQIEEVKANAGFPE